MVVVVGIRTCLLILRSNIRGYVTGGTKMDFGVCCEANQVAKAQGITLGSLIYFQHHLSFPAFVLRVIVIISDFLLYLLLALLILSSLQASFPQERKREFRYYFLGKKRSYTYATPYLHSSKVRLVGSLRLGFNILFFLVAAS